MVRALQELTLVVAILAGTIGGSQVLRFVQEYEQRLAGASQEADRQLTKKLLPNVYQHTDHVFLPMH